MCIRDSLKLINVRIEYFENHEKFKNGKLVKSVGTASMYKQFRTCLLYTSPRLYDKDIAPSDYYPFYIQTSVERDVRLMKNIGDLSKFIRFSKLLSLIHI